MDSINTLISALIDKAKAEGMEISITVRPTKGIKTHDINWKRIEELYPKDKFDWGWIDREMIKIRTWCETKKKEPSTMTIINWFKNQEPPKILKSTFEIKYT